MESQPQNPEFSLILKTFTHYDILLGLDFSLQEEILILKKKKIHMNSRSAAQKCCQKYLPLIQYILFLGLRFKNI